MKVRISTQHAHVLIVSMLTLLTLTVVTFGQAPAAKAPVTFTEKDREFALKYLNDTKDDFVKQLTGLSDAQLNFRAAEGRWTIGEIAEHIIVTEGALLGLLQSPAMKSQAPEGKDNFRVRDTAVILAVTNRIQKFNAPEQVRPNGRWKTRDELLANFEKQRAQTTEFMKANKVDMRNHFMDNPLVGMIDSFQWFLFAVGHSERHLLQLKEVKVDPNYPRK